MHSLPVDIFVRVWRSSKSVLQVSRCLVRRGHKHMNPCRCRNVAEAVRLFGILLDELAWRASVRRKKGQPARSRGRPHEVTWSSDRG
jgi:hypothetical protein